MASWIAGGCQGFDFEIVEEGSEAEVAFGVYSKASVCVEELEGMKNICRRKVAEDRESE
jgi:hypothetical protein